MRDKWIKTQYEVGEYELFTPCCKYWEQKQVLVVTSLVRAGAVSISNEKNVLKCGSYYCKAECPHCLGSGITRVLEYPNTNPTEKRWVLCGRVNGHTPTMTTLPARLKRFLYKLNLKIKPLP